MRVTQRRATVTYKDYLMTSFFASNTSGIAAYFLKGLFGGEKYLRWIEGSILSIMLDSNTIAQNNLITDLYLK